jgi:adenosylmethionine-8-amino-7-oxononanoate aminotransferase
MSDQPWPFVPNPNVIDVDHAEGRTLYLSNGRTLLDASGGAIISNIGHGRKEVADATAAAMVSMSYAIPPFTTPQRKRLVERLRRVWLPSHLTRVWLASGGSEACDAAFKIALQHFNAKGETRRTKIIGRDISYHGTTALTLAVGGHVARKVGFKSVMTNTLRAPTPYSLRSPLGRHHPDFDIAAAKALEDIILAEGPDTIAAFVCEPINGSSGGAIMPGPRYWPMVQDICQRHGILIITDEVMVGFGRTGKNFAAEHFDLKADIMISGKGLAGGYAPICGVFASDAVMSPLADAGMAPMFYTYSGHPGACAAADKVLEIMEREELVTRSAQKGEELRERLNSALGQHPNVAEIRGQGLFFGIEVVANRETLEMFPAESRMTQRIVGAGVEEGVFFYTGGTGAVRDILCIGPAFTVTDDELDQMVKALKTAIDVSVA